MDEQQQQRRVNQAAEEFASAVKESYRAVSERAQSAYELNAQLTEQFFNRVVENLRTQAESNRQMTEELTSQVQRGQEASRQLTQESVSAYMDFLNSAFSFSQATPQAAERGAQEVARGTETGSLETTAPSSQADGDDLPLEDYDSLNIRQISERLDELSDEEIRRLRDYESQNKNRRTLMERLDQRIETGFS